MVDLESVVGYPEKVQNCTGEAYVYVLRLFDGRYYVGMSKNPKRRVVSHVRGESTSPDWVKVYPPVEIESVIECPTREEAMRREKVVAEELARQHGRGRVRGGSL